MNENYCIFASKTSYIKHTQKFVAMNKLIIENKKKHVLTSIKEWKKGFVEVDKGHWEEGRSAERLANDFTNGNPSSGEVSLRQMLSLFLGTDEIIWKEAYIEHGSVFDKYSRPRMQDLAIWGEVNHKSFFVGVEAKVNESFGSKSVAQQYKYVQGLKSDGIHTEADKRLNELRDDFLSNVDEKQFGLIRYQLLYYLAGSFREEADVVFMPVFTYISSKYDHKKGDSNYRAYKKFMELLGFEELQVNDPKMKIAYKKVISAYNKERNTVLTKPVYSCYFEK